MISRIPHRMRITQRTRTKPKRPRSAKVLCGRRNYSLGLVYVEPRKGDEPFAPIAQVGVVRSTRRNNFGGWLLCPSCISPEELLCETRRLRRELDWIEEEAIRRYSRART